MQRRGDNCKADDERWWWWWWRLLYMSKGSFSLPLSKFESLELKPQRRDYGMVCWAWWNMSNPGVLLSRGALLSQLQLCRWRNPGNRLLSSMSRSDIARLSDEESTRKALEAAAREDRLDFQTAARILMSSSQDERKFGYVFHIYNIAKWRRK